MANSIEVRDLNRRFGQPEAVKGISVAVAEGEPFGFLGPNGAGRRSTKKHRTTRLRRAPGLSDMDRRESIRERLQRDPLTASHQADNLAIT
jgi:ABC-type multidrug transport system ATPase subunit